MMEYRAGRWSYLATTFVTIELSSAFHWAIFTATVACLGMEGIKDKVEARFLGREVSLETGNAVFVIRHAHSVCPKYIPYDFVFKGYALK
jgi:hypothetical protein